MIRILRQLWAPRQLSDHPRIFMIGYNKCGTKTLHSFLLKNGVKSAHGSYSSNQDQGRGSIAVTMKENVDAGRPVLTGMEGYYAFSDMISLTNSEVIEANGYFREMFRDHPDAFFVFNDRPVEAWVRSRLNHEGGSGGSFVNRYAQALGMEPDAVPDFWRAQYQDHKRAVLEFFEGQERFLHFDITRHGPDTLKAFFGKTIPVNTRYWKVRGTKEERARKQLSRAQQRKGV